MDGISGQKFSLPQPKKVEIRKKNEVRRRESKEIKDGTEGKKDTGFPQVKYCPPERDDNLNISKEGLNLIKVKDKKSDVTLEEIREKILNRPEKETPFEKIEEFVSGLEGLDKDEKIDFPSIQEGTPEEMEISRNVFRNLSEIGERRRRDVSERGIYMRPDADKDEVSDLWMYDGSAPGSVPVSKEKTPEETDQKRIYNESHKIMEKLGGNDRAEERIDNVMGGKTYKKYGVVKDDKEISFTESNESIYEDKNGSPKKDSSETVITRNSDGSYIKSYNREDSDGNIYKTELKQTRTVSSERTSETILKDNEDDTKFTKINSTETKDKDGMRKIVSEEVRPDGTKIYKEKTIDKDGKGKVVIKKTKGDGRTVSKERETGNVPAEVSDGDCVYTGTGGNIPFEAGDGNGYPAGIGGNFGGELKPSNNAGGEARSVGGSSANIPSDLNGAYNYFDKYFPEEAEDMKKNVQAGKLNILTQEEAEEILPEFGALGDGEGITMPSGTGRGIINIKLKTDLSDKEIAANMRHEYWHAKFDDYSDVTRAELDGPIATSITAIQETLCYKKEIEFKESLGLSTEKAKYYYNNNKKIMESVEIYLDLRKKLERKEIDAMPAEYEGIHKSYEALTQEQKNLINEQLDFYYKNI